LTRPGNPPENFGSPGMILLGSYRGFPPEKMGWFIMSKKKPGISFP